MTEPPDNLVNADAELGLGAPGEKDSRGWHSRGYLPHFDHFNALQCITFRLADSLPQNKLRELKLDKRVGVEIAHRKKIDRWLDSGYGCCALGNPVLAEVAEQTLKKFDPSRYLLIAWCVMPNHIHVLIDPKESLSKIVQSWKSYTGRWALQHNSELRLGIPGNKLWMRDYWDRFIRDQNHLDQTIEYISNNPIKAGLCVHAQDWPWSSASPRERRAPDRQNQPEKI